MRLTRPASPSVVPQRPVRPTFSFTCCCCGVTENRPTPDAPAGWAVHYINEDSFVFCPQDTLNVPASDLQ